MTGDMAEENPWRFSTNYWEKSDYSYGDWEAGLYYYGFRFYSPDLGRWINRDLIGEKGGLNLYGFVANEGINNWDILGWSGSGFSFWNEVWEALWDGRGWRDTLLYGKICYDYLDDMLRSKKRAHYYRDTVLRLAKRMSDVLPYAYQTGDMSDLTTLKREARKYDKAWLEETEATWRLKGKYDKCRCVKNGYYCRSISVMIGSGAAIAGVAGGGPHMHQAKNYKI